MNETETRQAAAVMLAHAEGKKIQSLDDDMGEYQDVDAPIWDWCDNPNGYRISPEPEPSKLVGPFTQMAAGEVGVAFANPHVAIEQLCMKVFGAKPTYTRQSPAPEPMDVEVWVHEDGRICAAATQEYPQVLIAEGWTLRRATIHPEKP